jgi:16S rRNA (guanine527-N7)-methyltransferase
LTVAGSTFHVEHAPDDDQSTAPRPPAAAYGVFGDRLPLAEAYVARLAGDGVVRGLIGPRERDRLWDRHVLNCAAVVSLIASGQAVGDLGSGAGLPGVVIALLRADVSVDLIEPLERRAVFLQETVDLLGLVNCRVIRARAENLAGLHRYDVVTARAVAPLDRLLDWALPLLRPAGELLAIKGAGAQAELTAAEATLSRLRAQSAEVLSMEAGDDGRAWVVRVVASASPRGDARDGAARTVGAVSTARPRGRWSRARP